MLYTKNESSGPCSFRQEDFLKIAFWKPIFWPCDLLMQPSKMVWTTLIAGHPGIIPVKIGQNPMSGFRGEDVWVKKFTHGQRPVTIKTTLFLW